VDIFDMKGWFPSYLMNWLMSLGMSKNMDDMEKMFRELSE